MPLVHVGDVDVVLVVQPSNLYPDTVVPKVNGDLKDEYVLLPAVPPVEAAHTVDLSHARYRVTPVYSLVLVVVVVV